MTWKIPVVVCFTAVMALPAWGNNPLGQLGPEAAQAWEEYQTRPTERAFAVGASGSWGMAWGHETMNEARERALAHCREHAERCEILAENDRVVVTEHPFAGSHPDDEYVFTAWMESLSLTTVAVLAVIGFFILVVGTELSRHFPWMLRSRRGIGFWGPKVRINHTQVLVMFVYLMLLMPVFFRLAPDPDAAFRLAEWLAFFAPIVPPVLSVLYLHARGALGRPA